MVQLPEPVAAALWLGHADQPVAPALLAGGNREPAPVRTFACRALRRKAGNRALGCQWLDRGNAQFHCLLNGEIHAFAARYALGQHQLDGRFRAAVHEWAGSCYDFIGINSVDRRLILAAEPVEQHDGITDAQNPAGDFFGDGRLQQLVKSRCHLPAEQILDELMAAVQDFTAQAPSFDDITLLILKSL